MTKGGITLRGVLAATLVTVGLATAASAQYGDMLKDAGKDQLKGTINDTAPAAAPAIGIPGGSVTDAGSAGVKTAAEAKLGGADMKGAGMEGGKAAIDTYKGKPDMPGAEAAPAAGTDDADK